jgi:hypothetical protein
MTVLDSPRDAAEKWFLDTGLSAALPSARARHLWPGRPGSVTAADGSCLALGLAVPMAVRRGRLRLPAPRRSGGVCSVTSRPLPGSGGFSLIGFDRGPQPLPSRVRGWG